MRPALATPGIQTSDSIRRTEFEYFQAAIRRLAGITLSDTKIELVKSRLRSRLHAVGLVDFEEYRTYLQSLPPDHEEWQTFVNCLTTNKTDWFRELPHFHFLTKEFLPKWRQQGRKVLQAWSAACSTGEEPYSLAATLRKRLGHNHDFEVQATDIDTNVLSAAKNGVYKRSQLATIPGEYRDNFFNFGTGDISGWMRVRSDIKEKIQFTTFNLSTASYPWRAKFDLILCRNVFIYFDRDTIEQITCNLYEAAAPGAVLLIGHSESLQNIKTPWNYLKPSVFYKGKTW